MSHSRLAGSGLVALATCALVSACSGAGHEAPGQADAGTRTESTPDSGPGSPVGDGGATTDAALSDSAVASDAETPDSPASGDAGGGYGSDGPVAYTTTSLSVSTGADSFTVNVWVPGTSGAHPVVSFSPGLEQPSAGYTPYAKRLASWGFVVLMRDDPGILVSGDTVASDLSYTVATWLPAQNAMSASVLSGKVDLAHVGLAGHSRGGQATLDAAEQGLHGKVEAWVGLDPVNTAYSAGTAPSTDLPSIAIPTLYLGAGVQTNCAPAGDDYLTLYAVSPTPSIAITVAGAAHPQFEDLGNCSGCLLPCSPAGTANSQAVLALAMRYLTAFFALELLGDASVGMLLQGAGAPADVASGVITLTSK
jgi:dienelactone hydrolase